MLFSQLSGYCPGRGTPYDWHIRAGRLHPEGAVSYTHLTLPTSDLV